MYVVGKIRSTEFWIALFQRDLLLKEIKEKMDLLISKLNHMDSLLISFIKLYYIIFVLFYSKIIVLLLLKNILNTVELFYYSKSINY